jgi:hypothetical protein
VLHPRHDGATAKELALQIELDDPVPVLVVDHQPADAAPAAGIVDEDVDPPEGPNGFPDHRLDL